jgi:sugar phosphate isomerase/epimerase
MRLWPVYAMDTGFYTSLGAYDFDVRCEMAAELGYDATYLTLWNESAWDDLGRLGGVHQRHGIEVAAVYAIPDISSAPDAGPNARITRMIERLEGCVTVELALRASDPQTAPSSPAGDAAAARLLEAFLDAAEPRGVTLCLYPHVTYWLERAADAARLCGLLSSPGLGVTFPAYHWYAADHETPLPSALEQVAPWLRLVNVCGSRRPAAGVFPTLEPLDAGELDVFAILGVARSLGFDGAVGIQGYSVAGDVYAKLRRSLTAYDDILHRLQRHPGWPRLRWGDSPGSTAPVRPGL